MNWIERLFSSGMTPAPTRTGNKYSGVAVPEGFSSLQASSVDRTKRPKKTEQPPPAVVGGKRMNRLGQNAQWLLSDLFGEAANIPGARMLNDRQADEILNRSGFFNEGSGSLQDRTNRALIDWYRALGLGDTAYLQSPFYVPTRRH